VGPKQAGVMSWRLRSLQDTQETSHCQLNQTCCLQHILSVLHQLFPRVSFREYLHKTIYGAFLLKRSSTVPVYSYLLDLAAPNPGPSPLAVRHHQPATPPPYEKSWLQNHTFVGPSPGRDYSPLDGRPQPVRCYPTGSPSLAFHPALAGFHPSFASSSALRPVGAHKTAFGISDTRPSPRFDTGPNRASTVLSSSGRRGSRHAIADSVGASSRLFLDQEDNCYVVGIPVQLHGAVRL
jgi:hypothetical protein